MAATTIIDRVTALVTPICNDLGLDLYDIEYGGGQLTVTIDARPGAAPPATDDGGDDDGADQDAPAPRGPGVTLDVLSLATRLISRELDHADPIPGHYTLEVTSPGLERTLRTPAHYAKSVGADVAVRLRDVSADERRIHGVLSAAGDDTFTVTREDGTTRDVPYDQVDRARTVFQWGAAAKGAKPAKSKAKAKPATRKQRTTPPPAATDDTTEAP